MRIHRALALPLVVALVVTSLPSLTHARERSRYRPPADIEYREETIVSEGVRLAASVFHSKSLEGQKLPTILMSHGWGGKASLLRPEAVAFARAGYLVVTFDYRGWGDSDGRVIVVDRPDDTDEIVYQAQVREIREVVDPQDQILDLLNAIHWVQGEPMCDTERIGLWGSSFSGGHVIQAAAMDDRVKSVVSQVAAMDARAVAADGERQRTLEDATRRTRGELGYPEPGVREVGNLRGAPIREKMLHYAPVDVVANAEQAAILFMIAGKEELFDNEDHAIKAHRRHTGKKKLLVFDDITHYGIYLQARLKARDAALAWYDETLKPTE